MSTNERKFEFFITNTDGTEFRWRNLTYRQARSMHKWTAEHVDWVHVAACGWEKVQ